MDEPGDWLRTPCSCSSSRPNKEHPSNTELPDVVLLDLMLPDLDGLSVFQILRSQPSTRSIPVLIVSALAESWTAIRGREPRYERYLKKPVNLKDLVQFVHDAASRRSGHPSIGQTERTTMAELDRKSGGRCEHARAAPLRRILE